MPRVRGIAANRTDIAEIFGVSLITVDTWVRAGCPFVERARPGRPWRFDTAAVSGWLLRRVEEAHKRGGPLDPTQERARKDKELADAIAMKNARLRAELVAVDDASAAVKDAFGRVRSKVCTLPHKIAAAAVHATTEAEVEQIITDAIRACLIELATIDRPSGTEPIAC